MSSSDDFTELRRNDPRPTAGLIQAALVEEGDAAWEPVVVLHCRATSEVLAEAQGLCSSQVARERTLGANILGQLGVPERAFPEECFLTLAGMLVRENDPEVLESIGVALGHLHDERAIPLLAPLSRHPSSEVRFGVVQGISRHEDKLAIATLIQLSTDEDDDVRNWSTFGLGTLIDADNPELREALFARVADTDDEIRGEALVGLARRKDSRVLQPLIDELEAQQVGMLALEAATELADPRLKPALLALEQEWHGNQDRHVEELQRALRSRSSLPPV